MNQFSTKRDGLSPFDTVVAQLRGEASGGRELKGVLTKKDGRTTLTLTLEPADDPKPGPALPAAPADKQ